MPLLAWVHSPVIVQLVLPERTRCGLPAESQATTDDLVRKMSLPDQAVVQVDLAA